MSAETLSYAPADRIPVVDEADVVVCGAGPGGLGAAVMAARAGAKVLVVERYGAPGGMAWSGEIHPFMHNHVHHKTLDKPVYVEWVERMRHYLPAGDPLRGRVDPDLEKGDLAVSPPTAMLAAEDLLFAAGARVLYHHHVADAVRRGDRLEAVVLFSKSGLSAVRAKAFVDATGDADLAFRAGCVCEQGGPTGHSQPMTTCFKLEGVDFDRARPVSITDLYHAARDRGEIHCEREDVLLFRCPAPDVIHFNTTRILRRDGTDARQLSDAEIEGRRQAREFLAFLRRDVPGFGNARLRSIAFHVGVRESRRVRGEAYITLDDYLARRRFDDAIARVHYDVDIHNPEGTGTTHYYLEPDEWYEIPYGCVVAAGVDNLAVGGRPISVDHAVHASMRVMPPATSVGQAAGLAAAWGAARGVPLRELDGRAVRAELKRLGANL